MAFLTSVNVFGLFFSLFIMGFITIIISIHIIIFITTIFMVIVFLYTQSIYNYPNNDQIINYSFKCYLVSLSPFFDWVVLFNVFCFCFWSLIPLLLLLFVFSSILFVNVCINILYPLIFFFMPQVKDQQSYSLHLILVYFIFVTTIFRLTVFKFYNFVFLLYNDSVKPMKNVAKWEFNLRKVSDYNLKLS